MDEMYKTEEFEYEIESGKLSDESCVDFDDIFMCNVEYDYGAEALEGYIGKGYRITGYNGPSHLGHKVIVPDKIDGIPVVSIDNMAFSGTEISQIKLPLSLKAIGPYAFYKCKNLKSITLPNGVKSLGDRCFSQSGISHVLLSNSLINIPDGCFEGCKNLKTVKFGNKTQNIHYSVFSDCKSLKDINLPDSLIKVKGYAFSNTGLTRIVFPPGFKTIYDNAFQSRTSNNVKNITCVFLGGDAKVTNNYIGREGDFYKTRVIYCPTESDMEEYAVRHKIKVLPLSAYNPANHPEIPPKYGDFLYEVGVCTRCSEGIEVNKLNEYNNNGICIVSYAGVGNKRVTIPEQINGLPVTGICCAAFFDNREIEEVVLPNTLIYIGAEAFCKCKNLKKLNQPKSLRLIGFDCFYNTPYLQKIVKEQIHCCDFAH